MKKKTSLRGIVYQLIPYGDSSLIMRCFSREQGSIGIIAKGLRKLNKAMPITLCEYDFVLYEPLEHGLWLLSDYEQTASLSAYPEPASWSAAECGMELIAQLVVPANEHSGLYDLLLSYLGYLSRLQGNAIVIFWRLLVRVFTISGIGNPLDICILCKQQPTNIHAYHQSENGFVCATCWQNNSDSPHLSPLSQSSRRILELLPSIGKHLNELSIGKPVVEELNTIFLQYWFAHHKQTLKLKSLSVLSQFYR